MDIVVRRPNTDLAQADLNLADGDRWIVPGDPVFSHFLSALSAAFPKGEDFFVHAVRNFRDAIADDPDLRRRVKGFIGQEAMHGREHRAFNERLAELGYPTKKQDAALHAIAKRLQRLPKKLQVSVTAASEHFTTVLAHSVLTDEQTRDVLFPSDDARLLIEWHALEELEHKDVAFDVFDRVSGSYVIRAAGLGTAALTFGVVVLGGYASAVGRDWKHVGLRGLRHHVRMLGRQRLIGWHTLGELLVYLRPGFHPRDIDTDDLVAQWQERLADSLTERGAHVQAV
jgi:predicted metal-dependent hydrolase